MTADKEVEFDRVDYSIQPVCYNTTQVPMYTFMFGTALFDI